MSALNRPDNFAGRVNYAAAVIANKRTPTRSFDNCFENYDGDAVAAALMRRAERNQRLRENMPKYISMDLARKNFEEYRGRNLNEVSRELRHRAAWNSHLMFHSGSISDLEQLAGIQDRTEFWKPFSKLENCLDAGIAALKRIIVDKKVAEGLWP